MERESITITNGLNAMIEAHHFTLPFTIEKPCPTCGGMMKSGEYIENQPVKLNGNNEIWLHCTNRDCRHAEPVTVVITCEARL